MSSSEPKDEPTTLPELERMLEEREVDPELADAIRGLVGRVVDTTQSQTRPASLVPINTANAVTLAPGMDPPDTDVTVRPAPNIPDSAQLDLVEQIAVGGMGEVHRVRDRTMHRQLAMKILHTQYKQVPALRKSFLDEAQITAQLAHPGIPPVHALGELPDGRPFFTMKEVRGRTLAELIDEPDESWTEHRRLQVFQRVCEAVAYAHARGVVHCDLKPPNVMVGAFGEVLVMDWGVARLIDAPLPDAETGDAEPGVFLHDRQSLNAVAGTPAYMPPEQATGDLKGIGPASDVYALGVMLYELLAGKRPYQGNPAQLLFAAATGNIPGIERQPGSVVDDALFAIIKTAMAPTTTDRYPDAAALGNDLARWRDGALKRERALALVEEAREVLEPNAGDEDKAQELRAMAQDRLSTLRGRSKVADRAEAWALEDQANELEHIAALRTEEAAQLLGAALHHAPEMPEARAALADLHYRNHVKASARRDDNAAARHELRLRAYDDGRYASYLEGVAKLTLLTDVPCEIELLRYVERGRRLEPEPVKSLGAGPLLGVSLPVGSYLLRLEHARGTVLYPVVLRRGDGWSGTPPGASGPRMVPITADLPDDGSQVLVPAGWFATGADDHIWLEGFVVQRDPVTCAQYSRFLATKRGAPHLGAFLRAGLGHWRGDWPAVGVSWEGARDYAAWLAEQTGVPWRLPMELEWEKAARGVDGRLFPWGDFIDSTFARVRGSHRTPRSPGPVDEASFDRSPYGVRGAAGNVRDWCADAFMTRGTSVAQNLRAVRGGSWQRHHEDARVTTRAGLPPDEGLADVGFRLVRSLA